MRKVIITLSSVLLSFWLGIGPGQAQALRTWVSGNGDDTSPSCSRTAPCKTFAGAIPKTAAGGEINCLDPAGYGTLTITRAIVIACESLEAGVLAPGLNGITIAAGVNDVVVLRGLDFEGGGTGLLGINFISGAALHVENCIIRGFGSGPGYGIQFAPSSGTSELFVMNTLITDNNKASAASGIFIRPTGTGTATGLIENTTILNGGNGLTVDGTHTTGGQIDITFRNSIASGNSFIGVQVVSAAGQAPARVSMDHSAATTNATGVSSVGQGSDVTMAYSIATGNNTGITFTAPAEIRSYQTNQLRGNITTNGAPSSVLPLE